MSEQNTSKKNSYKTIRIDYNSFEKLEKIAETLTQELQINVSKAAAVKYLVNNFAGLNKKEHK
ncbi:hypothetical protein ACFSCX_06295 [Bacillus salitolerans]|uniref:CopG family transcriptional regulator n=1 Tax=Bacillus salitolerans TaxID=1437434 RepID=A0ABW4LLV7_9BACI